MVISKCTRQNKEKSTSTTVVLNKKLIRSKRRISIGTATIKILSKMVVDDLLNSIMAVDGSTQYLTVYQNKCIKQGSENICTGDYLKVKAEDNEHIFKYYLIVQVTDKDDSFWNSDLYDEIDSTVNTNMPVFPNFYIDITSSKYDQLIEQRKEYYAVGNEANNPACKDSPLVFDSKMIWYYGNVINQAIADVHANGGGYVIIPELGSRNNKGIYYTGAVNLLSNVNLVIKQGATLRFMRNQTNEYYPIVLTSYEGNDLYNFSPYIYAIHQQNIAITGNGLLDGQEDMWNWRPWKKGYWQTDWVDNPSVKTDYGENGYLNQGNFNNVPVENRIFTDDGKAPKFIGFPNDSQQKINLSGKLFLKSSFRPNFIEFNYCTNILVDGLKIRNTPFWQVHPLNSKNILIRNIDIYSNRTIGFETHGWNNDDGIDPESCQNVVLERNYVTVSDDGVAIKAGRNNDGRLRREPCKNVIIRHSSYRNDGGGSAAISIGSEMSAGVKNVFIHDNIFGGKGLIYLLKVKTNEIRGGYVSDIYIRNCTVKDISISLVQLDSHYRETVPFEHADKFDPQINGIFLDNITTATNLKPSKSFIDIASAVPRSPIRNIHYRNIVYHMMNIVESDRIFENTRFVADFTLKKVKVIDSTTGKSKVYNTKELNLTDAFLNLKENNNFVRKNIAESKPIKLYQDEQFYFCGVIDKKLKQTKVSLFVDREKSPLKLRFNCDGTFTSNYIKFDDSQYWFRGTHYLAVNLQNGFNCNTLVYRFI